MSEERIPADYTEMDLLEAKSFDKKVKENFTPAIISTVKQIIEDYGVLEGVCVDVGCGTAVFAIELCRHSKLKIYALEKEKAICEDKVQVFKEIYRVLKKGGIGFVGGGFGRYVTEEELNRMKSLRDRSLKDGAKAYSSPDKLREAIYKAGIANFRIIYERAGIWAELKK
jgi:SAM-dependent methyltransferase